MKTAMKITMRKPQNHFTSVKIAIIKKTKGKYSYVCRDKGPLYTIGENISWQSCWKTPCRFSKKIKSRTTT